MIAGGDTGIIALLCFLGYLAALVIYAYVCHLKSEEKIKYGDDKRKLQKIVANVVQTGEFYTVAYAYWYDYKKMRRGKNHEIAYWYYGIGFNEERIYVVPLQFEKGEICCKGSFCIDKASVGKVESNISEKKIRIFDKSGQELVHLQVEDKNNSSHGNGDINLEQKAEAKAFEEWVVRWTSEINRGDTNTPNGSDNNILQTSDVFLSAKDMEHCLLQQAKFYDRGTPVVVATNKENDLFLIYYYTNTFYIVKVAYENGKLNVKYDYRRKHPLLEEFQYQTTENGVIALLKLGGMQVEFMVQPEVDYQGSGCNVAVNQTSLYSWFVSYLYTYRENINSSAELRRKENRYTELHQCTRHIKDEDKEDIWKLLDDGKTVEAIKRIQTLTGLGLSDSKKIAENPYRYL